VPHLLGVAPVDTFSTVGEHVPALAPDPLDGRQQAGPDGLGRKGGRLLDVERPEVVERVRDVDLDPGKLRQLALA